MERRCHPVITSNVRIAAAKKNERSKDSKADFNLRSKKFREEYVGPFLKTRIGRRRVDYSEKKTLLSVYNFRSGK